MSKTQAEFLEEIQLMTPIVWPDDEKYVEAQDAKAIGEWLILNREYHTDLKDAKIKYMYQEKLGRRGVNIVLGRARVQNELQRKLQPEIEFVMLISYECWQDLAPTHRLILIDHELCHMAKTYTDKGLKFSSVPHDFEEFTVILNEYGDKAVLDFHNLSRLLLEQKKDDGESTVTEGLDILKEG
jgi:hypothetical protein